MALRVLNYNNNKKTALNLNFNQKSDLSVLNKTIKINKQASVRYYFNSLLKGTVTDENCN